MGRVTKRTSRAKSPKPKHAEHRDGDDAAATGNKPSKVPSSSSSAGASSSSSKLSRVTPRVKADGSGASSSGAPDGSGGGAVNKLSLAVRFPKLAREYSSANAVAAAQVPGDAPLQVKWRCGVETCAHEWEQTVFERAVLRAGCPQCESAAHMSLDNIAPAIAQEIHPTKNDPFLTPDRLTVRHRGYLWWRCSSCQGEFQARVRSRVESARGHGACPHCSVSRDSRDVDIVKNEWHPSKNGDLSCISALNAPPTSKLGRQAMWWMCPCCAFEWQSSAAARLRGYGMCPQCNPERSSAHAAKRAKVMPSGSTIEEGSKKRPKS